MAYLKFNKGELVNLEYSLKRELLSTNHAGGYMNTTIVCCNTRKYHGLLVLPVASFGNEKFVLLSSLDESLIQHGKAFNLGIHRYGDIYEPRGHKYIREFEIDKCVSIIYRVGGMVLKKEMMLAHNKGQYFARYTLLEANSPTTLQLKPFLAFRQIHTLSKSNLNAERSAHNIPGGRAFKMYEGFPELNLQLSVKADYISNPDWYYNVEYKEERRRAYESAEDLFVPGYFELPLKKGQSIIFSASTNVESPAGLSSRFDNYLEARSPRDSFESCLKIASKQFLISEGESMSIYAGYPWLDKNSRETLLALPGITLYGLDDKKRFHKVLEDFVKREGNIPDSGGLKPDVPLWLIWNIQQMTIYKGSKSSVWKESAEIIKTILSHYKNTKEGDTVVLHGNGLLWAEKRGTALSWMDAYVNGKPVTERSGYQVELNSLWYNAVSFAVELARGARDKAFVEEWEPVQGLIAKSFNKAFWIEQGDYLADYVGHEGQNKCVRPNQLFACSFPYSPITDVQKSKVLKRIQQELLTDRGIRTLSPQSPHYKGEYDGDEFSRNSAYHMGTARPWLLGFYIDANLKLHGDSFLQRAEDLISAFEEDVQIHCIGSVSEVYDGDPPYQPHGCTSYSISVASLLWSMRLVLNHKNKKI